MFHFRLRRISRLAVDLLSWSFAGASTSSRSAHLFLRGNRPNSSPVLHHPGSSGSHLFWPLAPVLPPFSSGRPLSIRTRRYLATSGLLVALSLEVCGCNPVTGSSFSPDPLTNSQPLSELDDEQPLSFYYPADSASGVASTSLPIGDPTLDGSLALPRADSKPMPWAIPESVYFVYRGPARNQRSDEVHRRQPVATAFVVSIPDREHNRYVRFIVTARHVVDPQWAHCSEQNPASIDLRLNRRSGGVAYETLVLRSGDTPLFYTPFDSTSDLAVIPLDQSLIPAIDDYKFIDIPFRLLLTDSELQLVSPDQQVMTARPSARPSGELSNYPIFNGGVLSKMPTEAIRVQCGIGQNPESQVRMLHVWFIDAAVPQGISGAPVYTSIARGPGAAKTPVLLGIQSVAWPDKGLAGITPSPALGDLIRSALSENKLNLDFYRGPNP